MFSCNFLEVLLFPAENYQNYLNQQNYGKKIVQRLSFNRPIIRLYDIDTIETRILAYRHLGHFQSYCDKANMTPERRSKHVDLQ
jgi:hypothetical protein